MCVPRSAAADPSTESWQASKPWLSFPTPNCCHRCPDFITEMSLDACRNSWKWGAGASLIGSSTGHGCVKRGSKRKERELSSEAAATSETVRIINHFPSLASPLKKLCLMPQDYHKTVSVGFSAASAGEAQYTLHRCGLFLGKNETHWVKSCIRLQHSRWEKCPAEVSVTARRPSTRSFRNMHCVFQHILNI